MSADTENSWIGGIRAALETLAQRPNSVLEVRLARRVEKKVGRQITQAARRAGVKIREVDRSELDQLLPGFAHQGLALQISPNSYVELDELIGPRDAPRVLVALDQVTDPRNFGSILRTCWALGVSGVIILRHRSVGLTPAAVKTAAGAVEHVPVCKIGNLSEGLNELKQSGYWVYGLDDGGETPLDRLDPADRIVWILGAEGKGMRPSTRKACDLLVRIPTIPEAGSLNVAVAAGIALSR